eukprot:14845755-Alexandrium_andersonii.AAC.1
MCILHVLAQARTRTGVLVHDDLAAHMQATQGIVVFLKGWCIQVHQVHPRRKYCGMYMWEREPNCIMAQTFARGARNIFACPLVSCLHPRNSVLPAPCTARSSTAVLVCSVTQ